MQLSFHNYYYCYFDSFFLSSPLLVVVYIYIYNLIVKESRSLRVCGKSVSFCVRAACFFFFLTMLVGFKRDICCSNSLKNFGYILAKEKGKVEYY